MIFCRKLVVACRCESTLGREADLGDSDSGPPHRAVSHGSMIHGSSISLHLGSLRRARMSGGNPVRSAARSALVMPDSSRGYRRWTPAVRRACIARPRSVSQVRRVIRRRVHRHRHPHHQDPVQAPRANAIAEWWIGSARRGCLDQVLVAGERHLQLVLGEYAGHYNTHRPHRTLNQHPPARRTGPSARDANAHVQRRDRLGGLIHEYAEVA